MHWTQLRIYAGILALERHWPHASLQLTYLELDTNEVFLSARTSREVLIEFLNETVDELSDPKLNATGRDFCQIWCD